MAAEGQASCEDCPTGRYNNIRGASSCIECGSGLANPLTGQLQCTYCTPGRFALPGQAECRLCADGTATANSGSGSCAACGDRAVSSQDRTECFCKVGYYLPSYKPGSNEWSCVTCPTGADCLEQGTTWENLKALPGYWRPSNVSQTFIRCPIAEQCTGGEAVSANFAEDGSSGSGCAENRAGIACSTCVDGYRPSGTGCVACPDGTIQWTMIVVLAVVVVLLVWISVYVIMKSGEKILQDADMGTADDLEMEAQTPEVGPLPSAPAPPMAPGVEMTDMNGDWSADDLEEETDSDDDMNQAETREQQEQDLIAMANAIGPKAPPANFTYKFKIFISFLQIAYSLTTDLTFRWPSAYKSVMTYVGVSSLDFLLENITGADCFSQENYYFMYLALAIAPIVVLLLIYLLWVAPRELNVLCWRNYSKEAKARNSLQTWRLVLYFLFLVFPPVSSSVLRHYICDDVDGTSFLMQDYRVKCYTDMWNTIAYLSASFILLYPVGIPVFFFVMIRKNRHRLSDVRVRAKLGFLYAGYKEDCWWWEILDSIHKLFLVAIIAFFPYDTQLSVGMVVAILYLIALLLFNPYADPSDDLMHQFVQVEIFMLILAGYMFEEFRDRVLTDLEDYGLSVILLAITFGIVILFVAFAVIALRASVQLCMEKRRKKKLRKEQMKANNAFAEESLSEERSLEDESAEPQEELSQSRKDALSEENSELSDSDSGSLSSESDSSARE
jgi:ABC-type multidrug transport system fused ATPase/permease subunit